MSKPNLMQLNCVITYKNDRHVLTSICELIGVYAFHVVESSRKSYLLA